ncbi:Aste57867_9235 [Aphanomyces stellatus]|uniref:Aste57867_9235 protein n=1 Tax=Aphanomyces stellatus TaxID=120398 RepID=A0A485KMF9_9STRA|nr:hypothetical protein As57867_009199 [Aphanomyces stellatus]VFT86118.1 Aste57867_9235 [Aphanomyces stellatus]
MSAPPTTTTMTNLAPFNPTGDGAIEAAMDMLRPSKEDVVYDIGCGDARFLVAAAETFGCKCVGIEYDAELVRRAHALIEQRHMEAHVTVRHEDATEADFSDATLLFLYLVPKGIQRLLPRLEEARARGVKICTNIFSIPSWTPVRTGEFKGTKERHLSRIESEGTMETPFAQWINGGMKNRDRSAKEELDMLQSAAFNAQNRVVEEREWRRTATHHRDPKYTESEGQVQVPRQYVVPSHSTERDYATYGANSYASAIAITELLGKREI